MQIIAVESYIPRLGDFGRPSGESRRCKRSFPPSNYTTDRRIAALPTLSSLRPTRAMFHGMKFTYHHPIFVDNYPETSV
jgi:hypothetical protein